MGPQISHSFEVDVPRCFSPALAVLSYCGLRERAFVFYFCVLMDCLEVERGLHNPTRPSELFTCPHIHMNAAIFT